MPFALLGLMLIKVISVEIGYRMVIRGSLFEFGQRPALYIYEM